jgi:hypothetical protein
MRYLISGISCICKPAFFVTSSFVPVQLCVPVDFWMTHEDEGL